MCASPPGFNRQKRLEEEGGSPGLSLPAGVAASSLTTIEASLGLLKIIAGGRCARSAHRPTIATPSRAWPRRGPPVTRRRRTTCQTGGAMSAEDLERYEADMELQLYQEYKDVLSMFQYAIETERRFYLANKFDLQVRNQDGDTYFDVTLHDAWV